MTSGNYLPALITKNIIPRTAFTIVSGNIFIPISAPNAKLLRIAFNIRMSVGLTGSSAMSLRLDNAALGLYNKIGYINAFSGAPNIIPDDVVSSSNIASLGVVGTDASANVFNNVEIIVNNWDLSVPCFGTAKITSPTNAGLLGGENAISFQETVGITKDGLFINWGAKTPTSGCFYAVDQLL